MDGAIGGGCAVSGGVGGCTSTRTVPLGSLTVLVALVSRYTVAMPKKLIESCRWLRPCLACDAYQDHFCAKNMRSLLYGASLVGSTRFLAKAARDKQSKKPRVWESASDQTLGRTVNGSVCFSTEDNSAADT
jgi:hypothetical protein